MSLFFFIRIVNEWRDKRKVRFFFFLVFRNGGRKDYYLCVGDTREDTEDTDQLLRASDMPVGKGLLEGMSDRDRKVLILKM